MDCSSSNPFSAIPSTQEPTAQSTYDYDHEEQEAKITRRIQRLNKQLSPSTWYDTSKMEVQLVKCEAKAKLVSVSTEKLSEYIRGKHRDIQQRVYDYFNSRPELQAPIEISKDEHRELCMRQLLGVVREAGIRPFRYVVEDPSKYFAILEAIGSVDMSLGIKMGVQYRCDLFGASPVDNFNIF